jgi:hypothetical protein
VLKALRHPKSSFQQTVKPSIKENTYRCAEALRRPKAKSSSGYAKRQYVPPLRIPFLRQRMLR